MAQYKVPQDVEAEDKLLGPFTFRQFVYLLIAAAGIAGAWGLFQIFPLLALIPLPFIFFFGILALPVKKDQPMETYLAAVVSFYMKPNRRIWTAGQRESTIKIIAPKKVEKSRTRNISEEEASHRLSFLASIVDSEGYAIRGDSAMKDEYAAEADTIEDVLEADNPVIDRIIEREQTERKQELVSQMRTAIHRTDALIGTTPVNPELAQQPANQYTLPTLPIQPVYEQPTQPIQSIYQQPMQPAQPVYQQPVAQPMQPMPQPVYEQPTQPVQLQAPGANYQPQPVAQPVYQQPMQPAQPVYQQPVAQPMQQPVYQQPAPQPTPQQLTQASLNQAAVNQQMQELANNDAFSIQTIAQQANRITNNSMMMDTEAGLTPPVFTPMSHDLPHETATGQYQATGNLRDNSSIENTRPDLYGPQSAIFSS